MKTLIISLLFALLLPGGGTGVFAAITEQTIYAGDTPMFSNCSVEQTGPMELTVMPCSWTTPGLARVFSILESLPAQIGLGELGKALRENKAEWLPGHQRVRVWWRDAEDNIIKKSRTRVLSVPKVLTITAGTFWVVYMVDGPGVTMDIVLQPWKVERPDNTLDYLIFEFDVPVGTTDLNTIDLEVFTVRPDFPPAKGIFEK